MKKNIFLLGLCVGISFFSLRGGVTQNKLQALHLEIGNSLIRIKKEYPKAQQAVYTALDKLGKY